LGHRNERSGSGRRPRRKKVSSNIHNVASFLLATIYLHSIHKIMCKTFLNNNNNFIFFLLVEKEGKGSRLEANERAKVLDGKK